MKALFTFILFSALSLGLVAGGFDGGATEDFAGTEPFLKEYTVYPNPTTGAVTVTLKATDITQELEFKVYNLLGQEMHAETLAPYNGIRQIDFDLSKFPKGIYMMEISNGKESRIKRISLI